MGHCSGSTKAHFYYSFHEMSHLGCLHSRVSGSWGDLVAFCVQFKVVDQRLHGHLGQRAQMLLFFLKFMLMHWVPHNKGGGRGGAINSSLTGCTFSTQLTFISDLLGGATLASSTLISPSGILLSAWCMILSDCLISSTLHRYLDQTYRLYW